MAKIKDLTGQRFGRLVVCRRAPSEKGARNGVYWICKCDCGRGCTVLGTALREGRMLQSESCDAKASVVFAALAVVFVARMPRESSA